MASDDMELINKFLSGQKDVFKLLMDRYSGLCRYYVRSSWGIDSHSAEDLTQEAFIKVFQNVQRLRPDSNFKNWLMAILRNVVLDHLRKYPKKNQTLTLNNEISHEGNENASLKKLIIGEALEKLPERQREIVFMFYFWEFNSQEIGRIMNLPDGTVRSDLHQARIRIAELLEDADSNS
ncbi:MAG: RNA polymerase sigma factor [Candidatus Riflebacteria bacterium]|nr:RNA polymerase sigma factor [Candidatus Riflebacteria bacterium]